MNRLHQLVIVIFIFISIVSCTNNEAQDDAIRGAELLMETHPDSALALLKTIDQSSIIGKESKAKYSLLMSMALDKNYIDTTTFDIIQPAIDYYLSKGSADEKLRTYYYQGRIFQNRREKNNALTSYIKGIDNTRGCTDSLCLARTYIAMSCIYYDIYDFVDYAKGFQEAANIYAKLSLQEQEFDCLLNVLNGAILAADRPIADDVIKKMERLENKTKLQDVTFQGYRLSYITNFGTSQEIERFLRQHHYDPDQLDVNGILNLALANNKIGSNDEAEGLLTIVADSGLEYDSLKYQSIYYSILESKGMYEKALSTYKSFTWKMDSINAAKFENELQQIIDKHDIEIKLQQESKRKRQIIWGCVCGIIVLTLGIVILILLVFRHKDQKNIAIHRVQQLEEESESLKELLKDSNGIPEEIARVIRDRIDMLNYLFMSQITENAAYEGKYIKLASDLVNDRAKFMNSNRLAIQAAYPKFIDYLEEKGLTVEEINYVCLYAIGLIGKEVGRYIDRTGHFNTSSVIRHKLGLSIHETNIARYIRSLLKRFSK